MNDGPETVRRCLTAVACQDGVDFEILHIDSGSTDGTLDVIREFGGRLYHIRPCEYIPGRVLNFAMELCSDEMVVFLNADAVPVGRSWLLELLKPLQSAESVAAAFSRQIAREDAEDLFIKDNERAFGDGREHASWRHFFSMAASAIKRSHWQRSRFDGSLRYSEDIDWTYRMRLSGAQIIYVPHSAVVHSHNYTLKQSFRRHFGEGQADARIFRSNAIEASFGRQVFLPLLRENLRDLHSAMLSGNSSLLIKSPVLRGVQRFGHYAGLRSGLKTIVESAASVIPDISSPTRGRYTTDCEPELEARIDSDLATISDRVAALENPPLALILGGGYGRREGGLLEMKGRKLPYNDYDLYAVYDSALPMVGGRVRSEISRVAHELGRELGIDVDIAPLSLARLRNAPPRIEWYELRRGHMMLFGPPRLLDEMPEMLGSEVSCDEGERLLMNRSVGLILARHRLSTLVESFAAQDFEHVDFIVRNIYKAALAAGDLLLLRHGLYHYSYRERAIRLKALSGGPLEAQRIKDMYSDAVRFRSKPFFECRDRVSLFALWREGRAVMESASRWFIHSVRGTADWNSYAALLLDGESGTSALNCIKTLKLFGPAVFGNSAVSTHPQMRVRAVVPVLLHGIGSEGEANTQQLLDAVSNALLMPRCASSRAADIEAFMQAAEARMLDIWREVN